MDGVGKTDIPNHFKDVYKELYNRHDDSNEILEVNTKVNERISKYHLRDVKEALTRLRSNKSDPV